jgi:hypothetical protein
VVDRLGKEGLADTIHHDEIPFSTMEALYKLFNDVVLCLRARGTPEYKEYLKRIPTAYYSKLHKLLQFAAEASFSLHRFKKDHVVVAKGVATGHIISNHAAKRMNVFNVAKFVNKLSTQP